MNARRYELTDFEWSIIEPLRPNKPRDVPRSDDQYVGLNVSLKEIEALLKVWRSTGEQLVTLHRRVLRHAQTDAAAMTVPGVGAP